MKKQPKANSLFSSPTRACTWNGVLITVGFISLSIAPSHAENAETGRTLTRDNGAAVGDNQNSQTAGPNGPVLLQDVTLIQKLQRFDRERIPERVVHARGVGAYGEFVATADLAQLTQAELFRPGARTPVFVRFSTVIHGKDSPEAERDPRGFATKFYTTQGNWDLVGNNLPVFFIRDAIKFPDMVHALKPSPVTNRQEAGRVFDFFSHVPEATHMLTRVYSDYGMPQTYRFMDGNSVHAYKFVNATSEVHYVKFHWKSLQGEKNLTARQASEVKAQDSGHATRDLYEAIVRREFPQWDLYVQILKPGDLDRFAFNPLDATKIWTGVKETKIGRMVLNRNPENVFQETEQSALSPANLIPGIEPSEDRLLQGRLLSYTDTQFYRLGANHQQLPVNRPKTTVVNGNQDGQSNGDISNGNVNYQPSRLTPNTEKRDVRYSQSPLLGKTQQERIQKTLNFQQAGEFYRSLSKQEQANLISNLSGDLKQATNQQTRRMMLAYFNRADADYGRSLTAMVGDDYDAVKKLSADLSE
ncbi:catalase [Herbaspirillum rhizosphaerae]|uniref:Catalase n=1 Tax=Herbaspirillum rhizosphaerae TaxID=346179 RepID=A0ABW8Z545_9BURK